MRLRDPVSDRQASLEQMNGCVHRVINHISAFALATQPRFPWIGTESRTEPCDQLVDNTLLPSSGHFVVGPDHGHGRAAHGGPVGDGPGGWFTGPQTRLVVADPCGNH